MDPLEKAWNRTGIVLAHAASYAIVGIVGFGVIRLVCMMFNVDFIERKW